MTDEQAVRKWLVRTGRYFNTSSAAQALALLDAKDAEIAELKHDRDSWEHTALVNIKSSDTALSRAEQAEAALAERDAAIAEVMDRVHECSARYDSVCTRTFASVVEPLRRFILPAKPAVDPLVAVLKECDDDPTDTWAKALAANLRAAIERAGGVKAVFGEGSDYDNLPQCIKSTEFTAGRQAGGTISFEGEG